MDANKNINVEKRLLKMFLAEDEALIGYKNIHQNISVRSLTLLIFAVGWALCMMWSTTTRTRVRDATAVTFSVKCFNPLKIYPLSGNIFRKWFASCVLLFYSRAFNNNVISNVYLIAVKTLLLTSGLHRCQQRIF